MASQRPLRVTIVQQGVWDTPMESMPLAAGFLRAAVEADSRLAGLVEIEVQNFRGGATLPYMAMQLFGGPLPDVLAFSVLGWNFHSFGALAETFRRINAGGLVVFGGTHVAHQGARVFRLYPAVDVVVNGEGEQTLCDLLTEKVHGRAGLATIEGISFRDEADGVVTTENRDRVIDLGTLPSPILNGAVPLTDGDGAFRYDVALMETNRGCPYKCAFCYWGGAVGQKVRTFPMDRLLAEVEVFAALHVDTLILCDANFGMLPRDADFVRGVIEARERHGYPMSLETSWAKNKSKVFFEIVADMKKHGLKTSFTLALQSLSNDALTSMRRRNMRLNQWEDLVSWLDRADLESYVELIWGTPGETVTTFIDGYDYLAERVRRIATYPLLILPNTHFFDQRDDFGFVTVRGDTDDFEYVLAHETMTMEDNRQMMRFIFWARSVAENMYFRHIWAPLRKLAGLKQSTVLWSLADWFDTSPDPGAESLRASAVALVDSAVVSRTIKYLHADPRTPTLMRAWWNDAIMPLVPEDQREFLNDVFEYDLLTRPIYDPPGTVLPPDLRLAQQGSELYYVRDVTLRRPVWTDLAAVVDGASISPPKPTAATLYYRSGFFRYCDSTEAAAHYYGRPAPEMPDAPTSSTQGPSVKAVTR